MALAGFGFQLLLFDVLLRRDLVRTLGRQQRVSRVRALDLLLLVAKIENTLNANRELERRMQ
jgi:hypothetical protein